MSVALEDNIVKDVPATLAETLKKPGVPPGTLHVKNILLLAVIAVLVTVFVPAKSVATPCFCAVPVSITPMPCTDKSSVAGSSWFVPETSTIGLRRANLCEHDWRCWCEHKHRC